jgi:hypothetical protein
VPVTDAQKVDAQARALRRCPALEALDPDLLTDIVDDSACMINPDFWGKKAVPGLALLICHYGTRFDPAASSAAAAGPVASRTLDKLSVSYVSAALSEDARTFGSTTFGQAYLELRATLIIAPITGRVC